jgi:ankyrin repeat protein
MSGIGADLFARDDAGYSALMRAAKNNKNPEMITTLLKAGAKLNDRTRDGMTILMAAASGNTPEVVSAILDAGADINECDVLGRTALMWAARTGNPKTVLYLLEKGANAKVKDKTGSTALTYAYLNESLFGAPIFEELRKAAQ